MLSIAISIPFAKENISECLGQKCFLSLPFPLQAPTYFHCTGKRKSTRVIIRRLECYADSTWAQFPDARVELRPRGPPTLSTEKDKALFRSVSGQSRD